VVKKNWYEDESKAPKSHPTKLTPELESEIVKIRKTLTRRETLATRYAYHGAIAIYQKLDEAGYPYLPHISTINRVLKRNHLIQEKISRKLQKQTKTYYPEIYPKHPGDIYAMDLVTPRYIKGFGRIISVNRVDTYTGFANINQYRTKEADNIINFVAEDWRKHAKPNYLKLDNEACFKGSLNFPRTFGKLTRFCLNFGVQIVFIPFQEPWRNGFIESFNGRFNDMLWSFMDFKNLAHLRNEAKLFIDQHNQYQNYKNNRYNKLFMLNYKNEAIS